MDHLRKTYKKQRKERKQEDSEVEIAMVMVLERNGEVVESKEDLVWLEQVRPHW